MVRDLKYLGAYLIPLCTALALYQHGAWSFATVNFAFGLVPLVESLLRPTTAPDPPHVLPDRFFNGLLYLNLLFVYGGALWFAWTLSHQPLTQIEIVGLTLSVGILFGANGINVGHELGHRGNPHERSLGQLLLVPALYTHFYIEHNRGHHRHVATPDDPSTARFGESLYAFWPRTLILTYRSAWRLERERLQKRGSGRNALLGYALLQAAYLGTLSALFGPRVLVPLIAAALVGALLLETINYIEHYGLTRKCLPDGGYERVTERHSWNSNHPIGRIVLYELTRHSDHHALAGKPYPRLEHRESAPQLPLGYPASMLLALFPPLWFRLMNPRVPR
jgi:alkane 1-monooxygenase